ncbi:MULTISPECIES: VWA domain-containing protein [unclassified Bacillus (in: firmicutes)]|uniref:VWA domain-containing protein n=1 Tax=unclassified Bacillus (in: firmicutes) TaxID=185979 RepID=UPI0008F390F4|nr:MULTISPECIES: VWA domain-containing protein [unclassified Bacillus (in: firmicutes)]SFB22897.1 Ca-activated chloride channel family protein [Bacillus sp. UNCCL13]SFQ91156.1 Ca-activated chloride channel family protein [Bacillus sp. cl95]
MHVGKIRQILLLTDGCSNQGEDPIAMAALAHEQGITVNVIGVMEQDVIDDQGLKEIEDIALSGGGVSQVVYAQQLAHTVQMVTRKAMTQTIQGVVNRELQQILGRSQTVEDLPPEKRGEVMEVVDELGEKVDLEVLILVDTSASMKHKLQTVKEALLDLSLSLNARSGENQFSVYVFPGKRDDVEKLLDWTPRLEVLTSIFPKLTTGGITPTGPAIKEAISSFQQKRSLRSLLSRDDESFFEESM